MSRILSIVCTVYLLCGPGTRSSADDDIFGPAPAEQRAADEDIFGPASAEQRAAEEADPIKPQPEEPLFEPHVYEGEVSPNRSSDFTLLADPPIAPPGKAAPEKPCYCAGADDSPNVQRIIRALEGPLNRLGLDFPDTPLDEVLNYVQNEYDIPVQFDMPALRDADIAPDHPVHIEVRDISLRSALRLLLEQANLTYVIRDEILLVTTPEVAKSELIPCVYLVRDLIAQPGQPLDFNPLVNALISCVATQTWAENGGGEAKIRCLEPGLLVITQTQAVHHKIASLLTTLRQARRAMADQGVTGKRPISPTGPFGSFEDRGDHF